MATTIAAIYRYTVKGLSAERLDRVALLPGECLPQDRRFAIALPSTRFDPERPEWLAKTHFVMLMRDEKLAQLRTRFDAASGELTITAADEHADGAAVQACRTEPQGPRLGGEFPAGFPRSARQPAPPNVRAAGEGFAGRPAQRRGAS